mmetsp:Transcript_916/g.2706  ORF Transcript_916/g.2706 Transcript_916/m.2706 type:complete len:238 (-) Transcript_916:108-821(-)
MGGQRRRQPLARQRAAPRARLGASDQGELVLRRPVLQGAVPPQPQGPLRLRRRDDRARRTRRPDGAQPAREPLGRRGVCAHRHEPPAAESAVVPRHRAQRHRRRGLRAADRGAQGGPRAAGAQGDLAGRQRAARPRNRWARERARRVALAGETARILQRPRRQRSRGVDRVPLRRGLEGAEQPGRHQQPTHDKGRGRRPRPRRAQERNLRCEVAAGCRARDGEGTCACGRNVMRRVS